MKSIVVALLSMAYSCHGAYHHPSERPIEIKNESGKKTEVYWVNPSSDELVLQTPGGMVNGQSLNLNSYVNHTFLVRELPDESGTCNAGTNYASPSLVSLYMCSGQSYFELRCLINQTHTIMNHSFIKGTMQNCFYNDQWSWWSRYASHFSNVSISSMFKLWYRRYL